VAVEVGAARVFLRFNCAAHPTALPNLDLLFSRARPRRLPPLSPPPPLVGLVALLTDRESAAVRPEPENAHTARVADLEGANTAAKENVSSLTASAAALEARRADTATACASLATQAAASDHVKAVLHPRAGFEVSLYIYLTHLHWNDMDGAIAAAVQAAAVPGADPTAPPLAVPDTGRVRAVIADPYVMKKRAAAAKPGFGGGGSDDFSSADAARHEMHPIDLDTRGMSAVQVAHALWGMVEKTM